MTTKVAIMRINLLEPSWFHGFENYSVFALFENNCFNECSKIAKKLEFR